MTIQIAPRRRSSMDVMTTGIGKGLADGLKMLAEQKMETLKKRNMFNSLLDANVPENVATAVVNSPKGMQREIFRPLMKLGQQQQTQPDIPNEIIQQQQVQQQQSVDPQQQMQQQQQQEVSKLKSLDDIFKLRQQIQKYSARGKNTQEDIHNQLQRIGVSPEQIDLIMSNKLTDNIIKYFLSKTNNDPQKAKKLAGKFGYEV